MAIESTPGVEMESSQKGEGEGDSESMVKPTTSASSNNKTATPGPETNTKKPSILKRIWTKLDLDVMTVLLMFKGSLPPIIAIAFYQAKDVEAVYSTLGYLVAITSVIGMCIMPRGMFMQTMLLNVLSVGVAAAMNLLALYCATQARAHTAHPGAAPTAYNSSASAVLAIWLIFQTYLVNALRSALPQFQFPVIIYSIFTCVSSTYGVQFPTMTYAISFMERLLESFLTGFAIATGVSLFIIPVTCRTIVFKQMGGYLNLMGGILKAQAAYLESLEDWDPEEALHNAHPSHDGKQSGSATGGEFKLLMVTPQGKALKALLPQILALHTKIPGDINFAKREIAFGKMSADDMAELWDKMRVTLLPVMGLSSVIDILQRRAESTGWSEESPSETNLKARRRQVENLHQLMKSLHKPVQAMSNSINLAFQHTLITLELTKPPKKKQDEENQTEGPTPGTHGFAEAYRKELDGFYQGKKQTLSEWCTRHNIDLPADFFESSFIRPEQISVANEHAREKDQRQLFFALYIDHLLFRAGQAALDLVLFADNKKQQGALSKTKLIVPGVKTLRKWAYATFGKEDHHDKDHYTADLDSAGTRALDLGESFGKRKDPEHEAPRNVWERIGEAIRMIPRALRSEHSAFGFRVAAATMTVAIICYLHDTQTWFLRNRILWAMIMVPISMTRTAGQSTQSFALRILGTALAMVGSYIIYYIVDGKTPGVIVFLWLWIFLAFYIPIKYKPFIIIGVISIVTAILIIGYELQVKALGVATAESNGQPAYPTYLLAPYRLGTVCGGLAVAYIWTIFPYPISESTELRKDIGAALYLLANLTSVVHETVKSRVHQTDGKESDELSRAYHLEKARQQVFNKLLTLLTNLQTNSAFSKFQIRVGGRFPLEEYEGLIESIQRVVQYTSLLSYVSKTFSCAEEDEAWRNTRDSKWSSDFRKLLGSVNATSHQLTSHLSLLSSAMLHARPLPPYLEVPQHARYIRKMQSIDHDILSVRHIAEPEYSAFAVIQICARCINDDIVRITRHVKKLVGEIDFSFHIEDRHRDSSDDSSMDSISDDKKQVT